MMRRPSLRPPSRSPSRRQSMVKQAAHHNSLYTSSLVFGLATQKSRRRDITFDSNDFCDGKLRFYRTPRIVMDQLKTLMNRIFESRTEPESEYRKYNPKKCKILCQLLAQDIKKAAKGLYMRRYRIVTIVSIIPKLQQGVTCAMMFFQDPKMDLFSSHKYETPTYFILGTVYMIYKD
ncbi:dynein light chain Tctex-type 5-like [Phlebotomus papatasi]|uniref:dynein light chain Tctex-type 5-like n=1 Tax=Phlebotomus papatasi TaxID=29031 RepID=UPI00248349FA|nr:dynein light chain Tctex-type 5-like [Phlebotomus papatasi]